MNTPSILIVDGEALTARDLQTRLAELGYEPAGHATSPEQAIAFVADQRPDLVLLGARLAGEVNGIAAAQLLESERLLQETQSIAGLGTYVLDLQTGRWSSSRILDVIFGIDEQFDRSVDGWLSLIHPDWRERMRRHFIDEVLGQHGRFDMSYRIVRACDGESRWVHGLGRLEPGSDGRPIRMIGTITDITSRKQLEEQVLHAQRMESIGTLASGIAHDLNNVLAPIMMSIDLLKAASTDEQSRTLLDIAGASAARGADIVAQVLSFARGMEGRRVDVQLRHLIREIETIAHETFPKNIRMHTSASKDLWTILADPTQLHQVLLNLCINARDAMPEGGDITITAANVVLDADEAAMHIGAVAGPHVAVQVEDTGTGIPEAIIDRIFDPFFSTKTDGQGTGLGLSTSLTIVKHHGGFLRVSSTLGHGTRFEIHLPVPMQGRPTAGAIASELPVGAGEMVLVVDDEESVREVTRHMLETFGYQVLLAADGAQAVALYAERSADIAAVIVDMMMPVMGGTTAIRELRKINPSVRIVVVSGVDVSGQTLPEIEAGTIQFLPKPFSSQTLLEALRRELATPEIRQQLGHPIA